MVDPCKVHYEGSWIWSRIRLIYGRVLNRGFIAIDNFQDWRILFWSLSFLGWVKVVYFHLETKIWIAHGLIVILHNSYRIISVYWYSKLNITFDRFHSTLQPLLKWFNVSHGDVHIPVHFNIKKGIYLLI